MSKKTTSRSAAGVIEWYDERSAAPRRTQTTWVMVFFLAGVVMCWLYGAWDGPLIKDNQFYFFISERCASGVPPHVSQFDPKHALSMMMSGVAIKTGRVVGMDDVRSARLLSIFVTAGSISMVWLLAMQLTRSKPASHLSALSMLSFAGFIQMGTIGARPKVFFIFFLLLTMYAFARRKPFWAGVCAGLTFLCWQAGLIMLAAAGTVILMAPRRWKNLLQFLIGAVIPCVIYEAYFLFKGALETQLFQAYIFPAKYMSGQLQEFSHITQAVFHFWKQGFGTMNVLPIVFGLAFLGFWVFVALHVKKTWRFLVANPGWAYFCLGGHVVVALTIYDIQGYPDLFYILPFLAVTVGTGIALIAPRLPDSPLRRTRQTVCVLCALGLLTLVVSGATKFESDYTLTDQFALGEKVNRHLSKGSAVYAIGCTHLLAFNHVDNFTNFGFFFRGMPAYLADLNPGRPTYVPLKDGRLPDVVLLSRRAPPGAEGWIGREYVQVLDGDFRSQGITVLTRSTRRASPANRQ